MKSNVFRIMIVMLALVLAGAIPQPASAQVEIPAGATIDSATLVMYIDVVSGQTVNVNRITEDWTEYGVTWATRPAFVATGISFMADSGGMKAVDVTGLVQGWYDGTYPNNGVLLEQGLTEFTRFLSSEYSTLANRPMLEICYYTTDPSDVTCVAIQRPGSEQDGVADAYISAKTLDFNGGGAIELYTGLANGYEKQALVRFAFTTPQPYCGDGILDPEETCDPQDPSAPENCRDDCTYCGDGILDTEETCDPQDPSAPENCRDDCTYCGDGILDPGEICDPQDPNAPANCRDDCTLEEEGGEGCTPGYWKVMQHFDSWDGYVPSNLFSAVFDRSITIRWKIIGRPMRTSNPTLLQALWANGGGINALARHAVAALLNASTPEVEYAYSVDEVIMMVQDGIDSGEYEMTKDMLEDENGDLTPCPID